MLEALMTFVAIAEAGSFSRVARNEGIAVSSIARRLDWLEAELGVKLFLRSPRRLVLTDAGEIFLPSARNILVELIEARAGLTELGGEPRGMLTVTAPAMFGRLHVAPAVLSFLAAYPGIAVDLHLSDDLVDLAANRVDVAIRAGRLPDSDLVATALSPVRRLVCASPDYLARRGVPAAPQDLLQHDCLTSVTLPAPAGWWSFADVQRGHPLSVQGRFRSNDTGALLQAALDGLGIVHLASWLVSERIKEGRLVVLLADFAQPIQTEAAIHAVHMPGRSHRAKARLFVDHLRQTFGSPPYWDAAL